MTVVRSQVEELVAALGEQLANTRTHYGMALELLYSKHPMTNIPALFRRNSYATERFEVSCYEPFMPGIALGFEAQDSYKVEITPLPSSLSNEKEFCDFAFEVKGDQISSWLSVEIDVPLEYIRPARKLSTIVNSSIELRSGQDTTTMSDLAICLYVHDLDGKRHDIIYDKAVPGVDGKMTPARSEAAFDLPAHIRLENGQRARLAIYYPIHSSRVIISDIYLDFIK